MRWVFIFLLACGSTSQSDTNNTTNNSGGGEDTEELPPIEEQLPVEALRPQDAIGFAQMDPSREDDECTIEDFDDAQAWRINETRTLVWLPCQRGAYQVSGALFLVGDDGETERLALPYPHASGDTLSEMHTGEFSYDPQTRVAVDFVRYRGLGDCGRQLRYEVGSIGLTLVEHREQACSDEPSSESVGPASWPRIYPAPETN